MSSKIGPINYDMGEEETFLGRDFGKGRSYSEDIAKLIDGEVKDLLDEAYATAQRVLSENVEFLHIIAKRLLEVETISGKEFETMYKKYMGIEEEKEEVNKKYLLAGEKNDVDKLMSLQEELDNLDNKILEKYQEYEETEIELKSL